MSKQFLNELNRMKDLFGYKKGQVISEQKYLLSEDITPKQQEAMNAGWGPVTDETAKGLPVGTDGKITPKNVGTTSDEFVKFPCVKNFKTEKKATGTNTQGPTKTGVSMKIGEGKLKQYMFGSDGTLYSYGAEYGKWSCGSKPNTIIINGKEVTNDTVAPIKPVITIPTELKGGDGVKRFQDWMDTNHPNWVKGKNLNRGGGYGKFGPSTNAAWNKYKNEYLTSLVTLPNQNEPDKSAPINKLMAGTKDFPGAFNSGGIGVPTDDGELYTTN